MAGDLLSALGFGPFFEAQVSDEERAALLVGRAVADRGRRLAVRFEDGERLVRSEEHTSELQSQR